MSEPTTPSSSEASHVELDGHDLPAFCPNPRMPLWNHHPRVYLDVVPTGQAMCPYCGTRYRLKPGAVVRGH
jgi:uncharacterized Zn-finger protein